MKKINPYLLSEEDVTAHIIKKLNILFSKVLYMPALDRLADLHAEKKIVLTDVQLERIANIAWKHQNTIVNERDDRDYQGLLTEDQLNTYHRRIALLDEFTR